MSSACSNKSPSLQLLTPELSDGCNESALARADRAYAELRRRVVSAEVAAMTEADVERLLHRDGHEILRLLMEGYLEAHALDAPESEVVGEDGRLRNHCRIGTTRPLTTLFGEVTVPRRAWSARGLDARHPTDATLNLPETQYSLETQRQMTISAARMPFDAAIESLERTTSASIPKRQAEEVIVRAAKDFVAYYETHYPALAPDETSSVLVLSIDQKGVVLVPRDLREATRKTAEVNRPKLETRLTRGEKHGHKRMATVAAVFTTVPHVRTAASVVDGLRRRGDKVKRPRPEEKRVWASLERSMKEVISDAFAEGERRDPHGKKKWYVLIDGDPDLKVGILAEAKRRGRPVTLVLDFIHALEYLWRASTAFHRDADPDREDWVLERLTKVLEGKSSDVAAGMRRSATRRKLSSTARKAVDKCADYFLKRRDMMRYNDALNVGAPIASGVVEGTCRHLINDRLEITGARWTMRRAEAVMKIRALLASGDFDQYWTFHEEREWWRNHAVHYRDNAPPKTGRSAPPRRLHVVK